MFAKLKKTLIVNLVRNAERKLSTRDLEYYQALGILTGEDRY